MSGEHVNGDLLAAAAESSAAPESTAAPESSAPLERLAPAEAVRLYSVLPGLSWR